MFIMIKNVISNDLTSNQWKLEKICKKYWEIVTYVSTILYYAKSFNLQNTFRFFVKILLIIAFYD
jgi:hypothetical protein